MFHDDIFSITVKISIEINIWSHNIIKSYDHYNHLLYSELEHGIWQPAAVDEHAQRR